MIISAPNIYSLDWPVLVNLQLSSNFLKNFELKKKRSRKTLEKSTGAKGNIQDPGEFLSCIKEVWN